MAASADVQNLMDHVADLAVRLDTARDAALDAEDAPADARAQEAMRAAIEDVNASIRAAVGEIETALSVFTTSTRGSRANAN